MMINKENKKIIIISAFGLIIAILLLVFFIFPFYNKLRLNSEELIKIKTDIFLTNERVEKSEKIKELYNRVSPEIGKIESLFIDSNVPVNFIEFLENKSARYNLAIDINSSRIRREEDGLWNILIFQLNVSGEPINFFNFLEKVENSPYILETSNLLARLENDDKITVNLTLRIYGK